MINWGEAGQIAGIGFGGVFAVLAILWGVMYLAGTIIQRRASQKESESKGKAEAPPKK